MSESTALLLYHLANGVRVFCVILATFSGFIVWTSLEGMAGDIDNDTKLSLLNTCVRNVLIAAALIGLSVAIPDKAWFLALAGGAQ